MATPREQLVINAAVAYRNAYYKDFGRAPEKRQPHASVIHETAERHLIQAVDAYLPPVARRRSLHIKSSNPGETTCANCGRGLDTNGCLTPDDLVQPDQQTPIP